MSATFPGRRLRARAARRRLAGRDGAARLLVGAGGCGEAVGAAVILAALRREVERRGERVAVAPAGCGGMCHDAAQVTLQRPGRPDVTWGRVSADQARTLVAIAAGELAPAAVPNGFAWSAEPVDGLDGLSRVPFLAGQRRLLLDRVGRVDPVDLDEALDHGVYSGLAAALARPPEAVVEEVRRSGLAGRGGAYFPVATKWEACRRFRGPRSLVVNAEEGEPGVFKDRHLLEGDPHRVIEGALIAAYAVGAERIVVYVNGQARLARGRLEAALARARRRGLLGTGILGAPFACDVEVREGAGGYVLGEESVILESVEGNRPMPRVRPPYPVEEGLWGQPTAINNVETLANVPLIIERGADWFAALGSARFPGTKLVCISGDVARPGVVEVEIGLALGRVLDDLAGGAPGGKRLRAVLTGGPSGVLVPPELFETPLEPRVADVLLGSGNLVALDETRPLLEVVRRLTRFNADESCGKCTPCREGVNRMAEILDRVAAGRARPDDRENLLELGAVAAAASLCGLGQMAPNPVLSALRHFQPPELDALVRRGRTDGDRADD